MLKLQLIPQNKLYVLRFYKRQFFFSQDRPNVMAALLQLQRRLGKDQFPLIEQHFFPNPTEIVSRKKLFSCGSEFYFYSHNFKNTNKFLTALKNVQRYFFKLNYAILHNLIFPFEKSQNFSHRSSVQKKLVSMRFSLSVYKICTMNKKN